MPFLMPLSRTLTTTDRSCDDPTIAMRPPTFVYLPAFRSLTGTNPQLDHR